MTQHTSGPLPASPASPTDVFTNLFRPWCSIPHIGRPINSRIYYDHSTIIEGLRERTEHLDIFFFRPSFSGDLFPMFFLLVEGECQLLVF